MNELLECLIANPKTTVGWGISAFGCLRLLLMYADLLGKLGEYKHEMFAPERVVGGSCGALVGAVYLLADVPAGPIIGCALFGAVLGTKQWRLLGTAIGSILGVLIACRWGSVAQDQIWFAVALIPVGGLFIGAYSDRHLSQDGGHSSSAGPDSGAESGGDV